MQRFLIKWPLVGALVTLPLLVFFITQGMLSFYSAGVHLAALIAAGVALLVCAAVVTWLSISRRGRGEPAPDVVDMVEANPAWGALQAQAWDDSCCYIDELLNEDERLEVLLDHSVNVLRRVASHWNRSDSHLEYAATLPEALLATETLAARYRHVLLENIPFANRIKLSKALSLWKWYERYEDALKYSYGAYRVYRVFSVPGILSELASQLSGHLKDEASKNLAYNLKRAYLQEVANVAIDLYSGNFQRAIDELPFAQHKARDLEQLAVEVGPIKVVIVGQISSGKSTLTNALLGAFRAESGLLPTTASEHCYEFTLTEGMDTHIVDTPGLEVNPASIDAALARLVEADMAIWVMRANQPGRSLDQQVFNTFANYFDTTTARQRPAILLAATHIDCIPSFAGLNSENLQGITAPLGEACRKAVQFDVFCPLSLVEPSLGLDELRAALATLYERAVNARLNRIRVTQPSFYEAATDELSHLTAGTIEAVRLALTKRGDLA